MSSKLVLQVGCALTLAVAAASLPAAAQDAHPVLYASGKFPAGRTYQEGDLDALVGREVNSPAYLSGQFVYLGNEHGQPFFSTFDLEGTGRIEFGTALIFVTFYGNTPPGMAVGKILHPTPEEPLTLRSVSRSADGNYLLVQAESWSLPTNQNQQ
jgi:hypothetical protein